MEGLGSRTFLASNVFCLSPMIQPQPALVDSPSTHRAPHLHLDRVRCGQPAKIQERMCSPQARLEGPGAAWAGANYSRGWLANRGHDSFERYLMDQVGLMTSCLGHDDDKSLKVDWLFVCELCRKGEYAGQGSFLHPMITFLALWKRLGFLSTPPSPSRTSSLLPDQISISSNLTHFVFFQTLYPTNRMTKTGRRT